MMRYALALCAAMGLASVLSGSPQGTQGGNPVTDINGKPLVGWQYSWGASVLIFITNDCPIANAYAPEIKRIIKEYTPKGVTFHLIHVSPDITPKVAKQHAKDYGYSPKAVVLDPKHVLVKRNGVKVTPEAVVYGNKPTVVYRGRIDDLYYGLGKRRAKVTQHDLRKAIDAALARKTGPKSEPAIGCTVPKL